MSILTLTHFSLLQKGQLNFAAGDGRGTGSRPEAAQMLGDGVAIRHSLSTFGRFFFGGGAFVALRLPMLAVRRPPGLRGRKES